MLEIKTTYQSKNWNKRLKAYCKENRRKKAIKQLTISTEVASNWLTRYKNEMTDSQFKSATKKLLSEYRIYIAEYDKIPEGNNENN